MSNITKFPGNPYPELDKLSKDLAKLINDHAKNHPTSYAAVIGTLQREIDVLLREWDE